MEKQLGTYMQPQRLPGGIRTAVWSTKTGETINPLLNHDPQARGDYRGKEHPTQKPVPVIAWCIQQAPKAITVLDPFMGSGTTGVACALMLRAFTGIERERKYFVLALRDRHGLRARRRFMWRSWHVHACRHGDGASRNK